MMGTHEEPGVHEAIDRVTLDAWKLEPGGAAGPAPSLAFKRIVAGLDASEGAELALQGARELAQAFGGRVWAVHALTSPDAVDHYMSYLGHFLEPADEDFREAERREGRELVMRAQEGLRREGVEAEGLLIHGPPARGLAAFAGDNGADLVVVGSHGHGALGRTLLGSVADGVKDEVPASVLITKGPLRAGPVLAPTDGSRASKRAVALALRLGRVWNLPVEVFYVFAPLAYGPMEQVQRAYRHAVGDLDTRWTHPLARVEVAFGSPPERIVEEARTRGTGLVVMGSRGLGGGSLRGWAAGSVSRRVAHEAPCSVLLVKEARA